MGSVFCCLMMSACLPAALHLNLACRSLAAALHLNLACRLLAAALHLNLACRSLAAALHLNLACLLPCGSIALVAWLLIAASFGFRLKRRTRPYSQPRFVLLRSAG